MENTSKIDELIVGRVKPHIYAFSTNTIPNYLKVGDTYRPLLVRLNEWRKKFSDLKPEFDAEAVVEQNVFFRDYAVHEYLITCLGKHRLLLEDMKQFPLGTPYSKEFFKDTSAEELNQAVDDIRQSYKEREDRYQFYDADTRLPEAYTYASSGYWEPRPNQREAIQNFVKAVDKGRTNLLMYAVMRFGKSFTALCCAKEKGYRTVLVVSAKADVREEWKKTVQSAENFNREYVFLSATELMGDSNVIESLKADGKGVVIFLTLQDLQGSEIKDKHRELFQEDIDLLIIDETHFGARAESYGEILRTAEYPKDIKMEFSDVGDDYIEMAQAEEQLKRLKVKIRLHLSGTPYRILMGSEFSEEDIISFCQFSDIVKEQEEWDRKHLLCDEKKYEEWDNPYFGFPQMIRFAFRPSASALALMDRLKSDGIAYALSELFKPVSINKRSDGSHKKFVHEKEVLELFKAIDGSEEDENIFAFLNYDKIQEGKMCRHMVAVLPYCASCDALESLLMGNASSFKHLGQYEIINISGVEGGKNYKTVRSVKDKIRKCEEADRKTLTLTVNRMLTGSTVEQWDTMIFLKDTASPQEYDQAVFRLQNQYIKSYMSSNGEEIKYNMKPQTLLVDFDPHRMFIMQEQKSLIYNVNTESSGNDHLKERIEAEVRISPIITVNKGKIERVEAVDILSAVSEYSNTRGVREEAADIPVDGSLLNVERIKAEIERQAEFGTKGGLKLEAHLGQDTDFDNGKTEEGQPGSGEHNEENIQMDASGSDAAAEELSELKNKFRTYYSRILFFAFLTKDAVSSLSQIIACGNSEDNRRIMKNLCLDVEVLTLMARHMNPFILSSLDYKIQNINKLSCDESISPIERAVTAMGKFGKLSEGEITTPLSAAKAMIDMLPDDCFRTLDKNHKILDIASKMGEFTIAVYLKCMQLGIAPEDIADCIEAIPTSSAAYEFTRKIYEILGLHTRCISSSFSTYDILNIRQDDGSADYEKVSLLLRQKEYIDDVRLDNELLEKDGVKMNFNAVVGNPPYQEEAETSGKNNGQKPRKNIFQHFVLQAAELSDSNSVMIFPGLRWMHQSGKGMKEFGKELINSPRLDKIIFYPDSKDIFEGVDIPDGISIVRLGAESGRDTFEYEFVSGGEHAVMRREKPGDSLFVVNPKDMKIIDKIKAFVGENGLKFLHDSVLPRSLFGIESDFTDTYAGDIELYSEAKAYDYDRKIKILTNDRPGPGGRSRWFVIDKEAVKQNTKYVSEWQVVVSSAHPGGQDGRDNQLEIADNHSAFGRARVALKSFRTEEEAVNFKKYVSSDIIRFAFLMSDESLSSLAKLVPDILDYKSSNRWFDFTGDIDEQFKDLLHLSAEEAEYIRNTLNK